MKEENENLSGLINNLNVELDSKRQMTVEMERLKGQNAEYDRKIQGLREGEAALLQKIMQLNNETKVLRVQIKETTITKAETEKEI